MKERRPVRLYIPNAITLSNLAAGCFAVMAAWGGQLALAGILILICAVLDFLDGFAARMLKAYSDLGKQLDSLADLVSFGVAPGAIAFGLLQEGALLRGWNLNSPFGTVILILPLAIPLFSAIRLAKFNLEEGGSTHFSGMPVPADALAFASLALIYSAPRFPALDRWLLHPAAILLLMALNSWLMVSPMPMFSFKLMKYGPKSNRWRYLYAGISLLLLVFLRAYGLCLAFILYILTSAGMNIRPRSIKTGEKANPLPQG